MMENKVLLAGFGGQGVMLMGQLLGYTSKDANKYATYYPSYGPEMRGGTANCTVVISDEMIATPVPSKVDVFIAMNQPSLDKYLDKVKHGGIVIANSTHVKNKVERSDVKTYYIPADDIANELGSVKSANMVILGAYINITKILKVDQLIETMKVQLARKAKFFEINKAAIQKGVEATVNN